MGPEIKNTNKAVTKEYATIFDIKSHIFLARAGKGGGISDIIEQITNIPINSAKLPAARICDNFSFFSTGSITKLLNKFKGFVNKTNE
jgi:hypothetical protein